MQVMKMAPSRSRGDAFSYQNALVVFFVFLFLVLAYIWSHVNMRQTEYRLAAERGRVEQLREEQKRLQLEYTFLKSPTRIEEIAKRELGMRYPRPDQVITVE